MFLSSTRLTLIPQRSVASSRIAVILVVILLMPLRVASVAASTIPISIFIALGELFKSGKLQKGQKIALTVPESARFSYANALLTVC